jgi:hypothetical protein
MAMQRKQRNDRMLVPLDPALDRAINPCRAAMGPSTPTVDFALSVADGTSGLDLKRLRSVRERAWGR